MASNKSTSTVQRPQVSIILMGGTGTGKTTFTNLVGGAKFLVGDGLESCTNQIQKHNFPFEGRDVTIIDVPGFDDSSKSDIDILKIITNFLAAEYQANRRLTGILYFHRISDVRMGGASRRNYTMFEKLVGPSALPNVSIVTTRWDEGDGDDGDQEETAGAIPDQREAANARLAILESRFEQLRTKPALLKSTIDGGGKMFKHNATAESANTILKHVLFSDSNSGSAPITQGLDGEKAGAKGQAKKGKSRGSKATMATTRTDRTPVTLQIQKELVDEGKDLSETAAGEELHRDIKKQMEKHQKEMDELLEQMQETKEDADLEELQRECQELKERMTHWYEESEKLNMGRTGGGSGSGSDQGFIAVESFGLVAPPPTGPPVLPPPTTTHTSSTTHSPPLPPAPTNYTSLITLAPPPPPLRERASLQLSDTKRARTTVVEEQAAALALRPDTQTTEILREIADLRNRLSLVEDRLVGYPFQLISIVNQVLQKIWSLRGLISR
ncbi:hypothetical protein D9757_010652 [Collybiopsis confluens]|uniref:AIG1-type G domain-containing protein n=1 Tax=Collybiopsis confluens TaxID=2823264 RepID=A0A8H5LSB9_9AGAR|nr:hypothetical protein D9757_010652 [Collybiopsis confluens]